MYLALLHHPVLLKHKISGTSSLTNLDVHDIARISRTYGLGGFFVATPLDDQRRLLKELLTHWIEGSGAASNPDRAEALGLVRPATSLADIVETLTESCGMAPLVIGTSARPELDRKGREKRPATPFAEVRRSLGKRPVLLVLGTSHGLAPEVLAQCEGVLPPLRWMDSYNHLPVRAAAAVLLDRLLGDRG